MLIIYLTYENIQFSHTITILICIVNDKYLYPHTFSFIITRYLTLYYITRYLNDCIALVIAYYSGSQPF